MYRFHKETGTVVACWRTFVLQCVLRYQSSNVDVTFGKGKRAVSILKVSFGVEFFSNEILIMLISFF